jgi:hypothetical protein
MAESITLELLAAQQRRMLDEMAAMRGDIKVLTAIVLRHEETLIRITEQITAMVAQTPGPSIACGGSKRGRADWRSSRYRR